MNTKLFASIVAAFLFLILLLIGTPDADGCNRCGRRGSSCAFHVPHVVHHAPVHHVPPATVTNFIFNSQYPGAYLPAGGSSLFGYSLAAQGHYVDPAMILDRQARLAEQSQANSAAAIAAFSGVANTANALNDQFNQRAHNTAIATVAINALAANQSPAPQASALKISINSAGETKAEWLTPNNENQVNALGVDVGTCARCHNKPDGKGPGGFNFDGQLISLDDFDWASEVIWAGKMPKGQKLSRAQKSELVGKLRLLLPPAQ